MQVTRSIEEKLARLEQQAVLLRRFYTLEDSQFIDLPFVCLLADRSPASVWRDVKNGELPEPVKTSQRNTRWRVSEIKDYLQAKGR